MKKTKAVILERTGNVYSVLAEDGSFRSVRLNSGREVGEAIELKEGRVAWMTWMSAAALFLIIITAAFAWQNHKEPTTVAYLSVDINPSIELKLDANSLIQGASGLNADGKTLLNGLSVKGKGSQEVLTLLVERAIQLHYLNAEHPWVVLGASPVGANSVLPLSDLADTVSEVGTEQGLTVNVAAFQLTTGEENEAKAKGLTQGEYGLWVSAEKAGMALPEEAVKDSSARVNLLSQEKIQAEVQAQGKSGKGTLRLGSGEQKSGTDGGSGTEAERQPSQEQGKDQNKENSRSHSGGRMHNDKGKDTQHSAEDNKEALDKANNPLRNQLLGIPVFQGKPNNEVSNGQVNGTRGKDSGKNSEKDQEGSEDGKEYVQSRILKPDIEKQKKSSDEGYNSVQPNSD